MKTLLATLLLLCRYGIATHCHAQASFFDPTFGVGGKVIVNEEGRFNAVAVQPDGKIVVAGPTEFGALVARYKENGTPDSSFGVNGRYYYTTVWGTNLTDLVLQPDGKIVAIGSVTVPGLDIQFFTLRLNTDGTPDHTFGSGGVVISNLGSGNDYGYSVALQADGKIIVAGKTSVKIGVVRFHPNGLIDSSFGTNGIVKDISGDATFVDVTPDGKIALGGTASAAQDYALMAMRYLTEGTLDTTFNHTGIVYTIAGEIRSNFGRAMKVQPDGKIVVAGSGSFGVEGSNFVAVRYDIDGALDASFGSGGIVSVDFEGSDDVGYHVSITSFGKILLSGSTIGSDENVRVALTRLNNDGTKDVFFGSDGWIINAIRDYNDNGIAVATQSDGKVVVVGNSYRDVFPNNYADPFVLRYTTYPNKIKKNSYIPVNTILYPNPASNLLFIDVKADDEIIGVKATDNAGRIIPFVNSTNKREIDVSSLMDGNYMFRVNFRDGRVVTQMVQVLKIK